MATAQNHEVAMDPGSYEVLGVRISAVNLPLALTKIDSWIENNESHYVCVAAAHSVMDCQDDDELRSIFNSSGMTTPDGMPLVWAGHLLGHWQVDRVYGPDLMHALCSRSIDRGYRHFIYGGDPQVNESLVERLLDAYAGLQIVGAIAPPFRELEGEKQMEMAKRIAGSKADIVWVGLGSDRQERWMAANVGKVGANVLIGVGAAFDFLAGAKAQAPPWLRRTGLEWMFRLLTEPKRLWPRYRRYPRFLFLLVKELMFHRASRIS
jgi:N-acetylglucosaminyldiphosphoundecaprenol N-acetyl-beta-D-mannosaminyltransferase